MDLDELKQLQQQNSEAFAKFCFWGTVLSILMGTFLWPYTINSWMEHYGKNGDVCWWQGALLGLVPILGPLSPVAAVVTWIVLKVIS